MTPVSFTPPNGSDKGLVLIVDDTPANLAVLSEAISDAGFETAIAVDGERALIQIKQDPPDLILLDVMMPGIDGFETCRRIKADEKLKDIPIIFMTALADVENKVKGLSLGAADYITKPFQEQEVLARVQTHLNFMRTKERLAVSEARLTGILNSLKEIVWSAHLNPLDFLYFNPIAEQIYGVAPEEFIKNSSLWLEMIHPDDLEEIKALFTNVETPNSIDCEYRIIRPDGEVRWLQCQAQLRSNTDSDRLKFDGLMHDVTGRKQVECELKYAAQHDSLTNLANRSFFRTKLNELLSNASSRKQEQFAVLFIDLDRFKVINDSLGHLCGDQLLIKVGEVLKKAVRPMDLIARLGGDEFTVLLCNLYDIQEILAISDRIQALLKQPIMIEGQPIVVSASIGIVQSSPKYKSADQLLRDADLAMYQAKHLGKACHQLFSERMYEQAMEKITLEKELRDALQRRELFLCYQPIIDLKTDQLAGFEALVRWQHPRLGVVPPTNFIALAEETGLILPLGEFALQEACRQMQEWQAHHPEPLTFTMSVNISERQIQNFGFVEKLSTIVEEAGLKPSQLKLEITESLLLDNRLLTLKVFQRLQAMGFYLSLDDFGTGYSSLSYLHRFPINTLKIDRSFVNSMEPGKSSFEIVRTITSLARTLKMDVVAEGIETEAQLNYLKSLSCEMGQGYFFSKPLPSAEATAYVETMLRDGTFKAKAVA